MTVNVLKKKPLEIVGMEINACWMNIVVKMENVTFIALSPQLCKLISELLALTLYPSKKGVQLHTHTPTIVKF